MDTASLTFLQKGQPSNSYNKIGPLFNFGGESMAHVSTSCLLPPNFANVYFESSRSPMLTLCPSANDPLPNLNANLFVSNKV